MRRPSKAPQGTVCEARGGFYRVYMEDGEIWTCSLRGRLKQDHHLLVGDRVDVDEVEDEGYDGVISQVLPRENTLVRPPIANVDLALVVVAIRNPDPSLVLIDRILMGVEFAQIPAALVVNKIDLPHDLAWPLVYQAIGYPVYQVSAQTGEGVEEVRQELRGKISVVAGPSGAGKSSLINAISPGMQLVTGEVSQRLRRGKHTTRYVQLLPLEGGGLVADTPGFSRMDLEDVEPTSLTHAFPEMEELACGCRFRGCLHRQEPGCKVKEALGVGVAPWRYENYLRFLQEIEEASPW